MKKIHYDLPVIGITALLAVVCVWLFFVGGCSLADGADPPPWQVSPDSSPTAGRPGYDPYHAESYPGFLKGLLASRKGVLYVGVPDASVGRYEFHYAVPAGFGGLIAGTYDCRFDEATGQPKMTLRVRPAAGVPAPSPFYDPAPHNAVDTGISTTASGVGYIPTRWTPTTGARAVTMFSVGPVSSSGNCDYG